MGLGDNLMVDKIMFQGAWKLPPSSSVQVMEIYQIIESMPQPCTEFDDATLWTGNEFGKFIMKSAMPFLHLLPQTINWDLIWFKGRINKHASCAWLADRDFY